ncbi:MAG: DUF1207 domain-containing protein [Thermoguttaceae bacterium]
MIGDQRAYVRLGHRADNRIAKSLAQGKAILLLPEIYMIVLSSVFLVRPVLAQDLAYSSPMRESSGPFDNPFDDRPVSTAGNTIWEREGAAFDSGQLPDVARLPQVVPSIGPQSSYRREPRLPGEECWRWQLLPDGVIYPSYLAGPKESRFAAVFNHDAHFGWMLDLEAGARVGLLRYGTEAGTPRPDGWELDLEGAAFPRLDLDHDEDLISADFRVGVPLTFGAGPFQANLAAYHLSSHLGDEFMLRFPEYPRINYSRNALVLGGSYYLTDDLRLYAEAEWAFYTDGGTKPWEFQFGLDYSPQRSANRLTGSPFVALNGQIREEVDYGGSFVVQAGWQWRGASNHLFRVGVQYFTGKSDQYQFYQRNEEKVGFGIWYDY